jgi:hypothetical protein
MTTLTTTTKFSQTAENDLFSWNSAEEDMLTYKPTGQQIYQMKWYEWKNSTPVTDETIKAAVIEFWDALKVAQTQPAKPVAAHTVEQHGYGWCNKHHSYCYGDCKAN